MDIIGEKVMSPFNNLIRSLWEDSDLDKRCPFVTFDGKFCKCSCAKYFKIPEEIDWVNNLGKMVCDTVSLQLWCLEGKETYSKCIFYIEYEKAMNVGYRSIYDKFEV